METIDIAAAMAAFVRNGGAITQLDYAGKPVGEHRDVDLNPAPNPIPVRLQDREKVAAQVNLGRIQTAEHRAANRKPPTPLPLAPVEQPTVTTLPAKPGPLPEPVPLATAPVVEESAATPAVDVAAELRAIRQRLDTIRRSIERFEALAA